MEQVRADTIRWSSRLKSFSSETQLGKEPKDPKNPLTITLTDGSSLDAALLVGCDGIFSEVRKQLALPGDRLNYVGLLVVLGIVNDFDEDSASSACRALTDRRIFETVDGTTRLYAMPFTRESTMWQLSFPCGLEEAQKLSKNSQKLKKEILRRCAHWHAPVGDLLKRTELEDMSGYPVWDREVLQPQVLRPAGEKARRVATRTLARRPKVGGARTLFRASF